MGGRATTQDLGAIAIIGVLGITAYHLLLNYVQLTVTARAVAFGQEHYS